MGTEKVKVNIQPEQRGTLYSILPEGANNFLSVPSEVEPGVLKNIKRIEEEFTAAQQYLQGLAQRFGNIEVVVPDILKITHWGERGQTKKRATKKRTDEK